jgi:hypothetical protein
MHHAVKLLILKQVSQSRPVCDVNQLKFETGMWGELLESAVLELRIVVVVEVIDANNRITTPQQPLDDVHANKTSCASYENLQFIAPKQVASINLFITESVKASLFRLTVMERFWV